MCFSMAMIMLLMLFSTLCPIQTSFFFLHSSTVSYMHIMHSDYSPTSSLISLPYCLHPPYSLHVPLPGSCLWLFCDPLTLTRAMWVNTTLELSTGAWWGHKWVCRGRQWLLISPDLSVANSWAVRTEAPEALLHPCLVVMVPFSCQFSVDIGSFSEFVIVAVASSQKIALPSLSLLFSPHIHSFPSPVLLPEP